MLKGETRVPRDYTHYTSSVDWNTEFSSVWTEQEQNLDEHLQAKIQEHFYNAYKHTCEEKHTPTCKHIQQHICNHTHFWLTRITNTFKNTCKLISCLHLQEHLSKHMHLQTHTPTNVHTIDQHFFLKAPKPQMFIPKPQFTCISTCVVHHHQQWFTLATTKWIYYNLLKPAYYHHAPAN